MAAGALLAILATAVVSSTAMAQSGTDEVRITARKLANNKIEFGLQQHRTDGTWSGRLLPTKRFFPPTATVGGWLNSTPLTVTASGTDVTVRITARKLANGKVEFGLQRQTNGTWSGRLLPTNRFFPTTATTGSWLNSSPISATTTITTTPTSPQAATGYTAVAAGSSYSCGLRTDGTITCWGGDSRLTRGTPPSDGQYTAITDSCAIRTDGTITCWDNPVDVSSGDYADDGPPQDYADDSGEPEYTDPPDGQYTAITTSRLGLSCALRTNGTTTCWGWYYGNTPEYGPPDGQYTAISGSCGLRANGTITCSGTAADATAGQYTAIAASSNHSCALRTDGTINCWGDNEVWNYETQEHEQADAPDGQYTAITAGGGYLTESGWHSCAIRTDGTIACWGSNHYGQTDAPDGQYTAIAASSNHTCAIRTDGTITCWGAEGRTEHPA